MIVKITSKSRKPPNFRVKKTGDMCLYCRYWIQGSWKKHKDEHWECSKYPTAHLKHGFFVCDKYDC